VKEKGCLRLIIWMNDGHTVYNRQKRYGDAFRTGQTGVKMKKDGRSSPSETTAATAIQDQRSVLG
jgi:hypothetical protein